MRRGIDLTFQNWHKEFDEFWLENSKVPKIYTLMGCLWPNYIMFELKKYRGVMFDCTQDWHKVWRKTGLCFQKLTWGIWQISTRALENLEIGTLMAYFCLKLKMYELKNCRGVMCHDNSEWCKIWRRTDLSVQNWHEALEDLKNLYFNGLLLNKVYNVWAKKSIGEFCLMALKIDATSEGKLTCAFKNYMRNLANFHLSMFESLKIRTLMGSFYPK